MEHITLSNGINMPMLGFGVFQVDDSAVCERVVGDAIEVGYRLFDTAMTYNNEEAVGRAVRNSGIGRKEFFITTKVWISDAGYDRTLQAFDLSLNKLGLDYLDLYLIHMPFGDYYGSWRAMERLYKERRIRAIGVCNFSPARLMDMSYNFEILPAVNQIESHIHCQRKEELAVMGELGIQPQAWAPFAEGMKGTFTDPVLTDIALKHNKTTAQVMLRWNIQRGVVVIPKSVHKERMIENFDVWDFSLDEEDMQRIATLNKGIPTMLDTEKPSEVRRLYSYLDNPVLTSLK
ncbi:aldo/keto reductase [Bacteroides finegoldii]|uniref:aldo/keto reductase n=1 Tax=Bacteroides finegoldii TaxID=338188 RepID=UPI0018A099E6|nr:aldo/keto reductase [Bacteroides finegoldii]